MKLPIIKRIILRIKWFLKLNKIPDFNSVTFPCINKEYPKINLDSFSSEQSMIGGCFPEDISKK